MCWSETASISMVGIGAAATVVTAVRGQPRAIWLTLGYFTLMEALQVGGYVVVDECGTTSNRTITLLSFLHIVFQPFFINAFAMELLPAPVRARLRRWVYSFCAVAALVMLAQLYPFEWAGNCGVGDALCGVEFCTVSGDWHIAWNIPYNGLFSSYAKVLGQFPSYTLAVFLMPMIYGIWRFVLFHVLVGPFLSSALTSNPNEAPAIWCLFSIGILLVALNPSARKFFQVNTWWVWPKSWQA